MQNDITGDVSPVEALPTTTRIGIIRNGSEKWNLPPSITNMTAKLTLDKAGRVMIPKPLRQQLRLGPGDSLQLESEGEQITLRPLRPKALLKKERGVWVYQGESTGVSITAVIERERARRLGELMG
ncbi:MAG: AbrB/MazE/SpoVT family DNA-binding domain-containing protein [Bryobacteraceae bacterium]